jgi:Protein of unknown function (DUF2752)
MKLPAIYAPMLRQKWLCLAVLALGIALVGAQMLGFSVVRCSFYQLTGLPCLGCGLTRGMSALVRGQVQRAYTWHPFTFVFALGAVLMFLATILPTAPRTTLANWVQRIEERTAICYWLVLALTLFGVWRMIFHPALG